MSLILYVSGPMSGHPNLNKPAFHTAKAELEAVGYSVLSPADLGCGPDVPWYGAMKLAVGMMMQADAVAYLEGERHVYSRGMTLELLLAQQLQMMIAPVGSWLLEHRRWARPRAHPPLPAPPV